MSENEKEKENENRDIAPDSEIPAKSEPTTEEIHSGQEDLSSPATEPSPTGSEVPQHPIYEGWQSTFSGILFRPDMTIDALVWNDRPRMRLDALLVVLLIFTIMGLMKFSPSSPADSMVRTIAAIANGMLVWLGVALCMRMISTFQRKSEGKERIRLNKALVNTGWIFTPLIFLAPLVCYKQILGPVFFLLAVIPIWWSIVLGIMTFNKSLSMTTTQLVLLSLIVPPLLCFAYIFWLLFLVIYVCLESAQSLGV